MSWNKETFKERWKDEKYSFSWLDEWNDNYSRYEAEFIRVLRVLKKFEWESLLEIGCGMGKNIFMLDDLFEDKEFFGTDINKVFLEEFARLLRNKRYEVNNYSKYSIDKMDTEKLDFGKRRFDVILSYEHLQHLHPEAYKNAVERIKKYAKYIVIYEGYKEGVDVIKSGAGGRWSHEYEKDFKGEIIHKKIYKIGYILLVVKI